MSFLTNTRVKAIYEWLDCLNKFVCFEIWGLFHLPVQWVKKRANFKANKSLQAIQSVLYCLCSKPCQEPFKKRIIYCIDCICTLLMIVSRATVVLYFICIGLYKIKCYRLIGHFQLCYRFVLNGSFDTLY